MTGGRLLMTVAMLVLAAAARADADDSVGAHLSDDYLAAGGALSLAAPVAADAFLAGGTVKIGNPVGGSLFTAGGRVELEAPVGGDVHAAGGEVNLGPGTDIGGETTIAGSRVLLDGVYRGPVTVAGARVLLRGHVLGDVDVRSADFRIEPGAQIDGHLRYHTAQTISVPAGVQIAGGLEHVPTEARRFGWFPRPGLYRDTGRLNWPRLAALWLVGALYAALFPAVVARVRAQIAGEPWVTIGIGILAALVVPVAALALAVTIIGLPLAFIALLGYLLLLVGGYVAGALWLADAALGRARIAESGRMLWRLLAFAGVVILLALLRRVPIVGALANYVVWWAGIGAIVLVFIRRGDPGPVAAPAPA
jgi:cytoskeletal protein CcmA (bactofilin family)